MLSDEASFRFVHLDNSVAYQIRRLARLLRIELNQVLAKATGNLTAEQWIILVQLYDKEAVNQNDLTDAVLQDRANITRHLNNLEANGYIHRAQDEGDGRRNLVQLTEAGISLIEYVVPIVSELRVKRYQGLSQEDLMQLLKYIRIIETNVLNNKHD
jgi:MarR family transcriptional regulator for hemolysin